LSYFWILFANNFHSTYQFEIVETVLRRFLRVFGLSKENYDGSAKIVSALELGYSNESGIYVYYLRLIPGIVCVHHENITMTPN
jgi:hypothetical protein